ncbi:cyclic nucleotide-binding domain-containing protein [Microvirga tunisiensis]|uniref:Cyclic nucleotide-binding domain-containing protein n=1 Tax=Pannonibacter tanglangensis TaxID=2750084 RepID=A0A7X5EZX3_9HYPH|nr:cyclic nucleotide-gated ion channel [Pannonibacter sp. XCT-53]NBN77201.1 cyclic nucleotide-binding domain-containing protein [Pannonibacter sp. XCT-53]
MASLKTDLYRWLEDSRDGDVVARWINAALILLVLVTVAISVLETVPGIDAASGGWLADVQMVAGLVFLGEYLARLYVADLHPPLRRHGPVAARLRYAVQPMALIDLLAVLPLLLVLVLPVSALPALAVLRLLRFLKLVRYSPALRSLVSAVVGERRALLGSLFIVCGVILVASTLMYMVEHDVQPDVFGSIPLAAWWAVTTATTTGYGDAVPVTPLGRLIAAVVMMTGYALLALPVGIIASAFAREVHSRDFVVTWSMVSRVPLFEDLNAAEVAEIAKLLRSHTVLAGEVIAERGDAAHCMYFVAAGEVQVDLPTETVRLGEGAFFGELALLRQRRRAATVRAVTRTQLLVLDAGALRQLLLRNPHIAARIEREAASREAWGQRSAGDIAEEELTQAEALDIPPDAGSR